MRIKDMPIYLKYFYGKLSENINRKIALHFLTKTPIKISENKEIKDVIFTIVDGVVHIENCPDGYLKPFYPTEGDMINAIYDGLEKEKFKQYMGYPYDEDKLDFFRNKANILLKAVINSEKRRIKTTGRPTRWGVWKCNKCGKISTEKICSKCGKEYVGNWNEWG